MEFDSIVPVDYVELKDSENEAKLKTNYQKLRTLAYFKQMIITIQLILKTNNKKKIQHVQKIYQEAWGRLIGKCDFLIVSDTLDKVTNQLYDEYVKIKISNPEILHKWHSAIFPEEKNLRFESINPFIEKILTYDNDYLELVIDSLKLLNSNLNFDSCYEDKKLVIKKLKKFLSGKAVKNALKTLIKQLNLGNIWFEIEMKEQIDSWLSIYM